MADFVYDAGGRETARNLGNGLTTSRSYFADNQIQSIATPTVETLTYTYDPNKNPTSETRSGVMAPYSWSTGPAGFDDEDRLTNWQRTNGDSQTWNLSPVHDWNSTTINGAVQTRTHGPAHEILTMAGAEVDPTPAVLQHDPKGNMTTDDRGCGMAWDFDNMLQSFAASGVTGLKDATYEYDVIGRRVVKNVAESGGTQTTLFVQAGQQVACEYTLASPITDCDRQFTYGSYIDETLFFDDRVTATPYYFQHNRQYNTYALTDVSAAVSKMYRYDSHGRHKAVSPSGASGTSDTMGNHCITYTGRSLDRESSLFLFRSRMYCPRRGRFCSIDSELFTDGLNNYASYFSITSVDPSGHCAKLTCKEIGKIANDMYNSSLKELWKLNKKKCNFDVACCDGDDKEMLKDKRCDACTVDPFIKGEATPPRLAHPTATITIGVCQGNSTSQSQVRETILHEFRHAMDICNWGIDEVNTNGMKRDQQICSELNAYGFDGGCAPSNRPIGQSEDDCIIQSAWNSIQPNYPELTEAQFTEIARRLLKTSKGSGSFIDTRGCCL